MTHCQKVVYHVVVERLYANIKKMLNTFDGLLIAFESYQFATSLSSSGTSILKIVEGLYCGFLCINGLFSC